MKLTTKTLILIRHGQAAPDGKSDKLRELTPEGKSDSAALGKKLAAVELFPDLVLCSPATRTKQTLDQLALTLKMSRIEFDESIYLSDSTGELSRALVKRIDNLANVVVLVGHNPTISGLATLLAGQAINMSTGNGLVLSIKDTDKWDEAMASDGLWSVQKDFRP